MMLKKTLLVLAVASTVVAAGCSNQPNNLAEPVAAPAPTTPVTQQGKLNLDYDALYTNSAIKEYAKKMIGTEAPDFTVQNLKGEDVKLSSFKGKKVILVLAETTCAGCMSLKPTLDEFKKVHQDVTVLEAYFQEPTEVVRNYLKQANAEEDNSILVGEKPNTIYEDFKKPGWTPAIYFIDSEGIIQFLDFGAKGLTQLEDMTKLAF